MPRPSTDDFAEEFQGGRERTLSEDYDQMGKHKLKKRKEIKHYLRSVTVLTEDEGSHAEPLLEVHGGKGGEFFDSRAVANGNDEIQTADFERCAREVLSLVHCDIGEMHLAKAFESLRSLDGPSMLLQKNEIDQYDFSQLFDDLLPLLERGSSKVKIKPTEYAASLLKAHGGQGGRNFDSLARGGRIEKVDFEFCAKALLHKLECDVGESVLTNAFLCLRSLDRPTLLLQKNQLSKEDFSQLFDDLLPLIDDMILQYTAVVSGKAIHFTPDGYKMRCFHQRKVADKVDFFTVVTMYNEDYTELERTMAGIYQNLLHRCDMEGADAWKKFAICIVSDGRTKANKKTLEYAGNIGIFNREAMEETGFVVGSSDVRMHLFEANVLMESTRCVEVGGAGKAWDGLYKPTQGLNQYTSNGRWLQLHGKHEKWTLGKGKESAALIAHHETGPLKNPSKLTDWKSADPGVETNGKIVATWVSPRRKNFPLQTIFALKEKNGGKLDSHLWFFNAFCSQLRPDFVFLVDVGTMPLERSLYMLYRCMADNDRVAGVCGEIAVLYDDAEEPPDNIWDRIEQTVIVDSQHFEYKISHFLDKSLESTYGFISVLPGAFSGYRWEAIEEVNGKGPLVEYFRSLTADLKELGAFKANMYLAEDRILCYELVARKGCNWTLEYVKNAVAETDVPQTIDVLIKQRRRWLNGSFFAMMYAILNFNRFWLHSTHCTLKKLLITVQFFYFVLTLVMNWVLVANFYLTFYFLVTGPLFVGKSDGTLKGLRTVISWGLNLIYIFIILLQVIMGLATNPNNARHMYILTGFLFTGFSYLLIALSITFVFLNDNDEVALFGLTWFYMKIITVIVTGVYFIAGFIHNEFSIIRSYFPYIAMLPTFINVFTIYSYCNMHDISWGTKEETKEADKEAAKREIEAIADGADYDYKLDQNQKLANEKLALLMEERAKREKSHEESDKVLLCFLLHSFLLE
jgi:cellulose synthase/poly-beta-1,6-N-acetylglucosamine synthase-like glycosyltransferase